MKDSFVRKGLCPVGLLAAIAAAVVVLSMVPTARAQVQQREFVFDDDCLPPRDSSYLGQFHLLYAAGLIRLDDPIHSAFTSCDPPPKGARGSSTTHSFDSTVEARVTVVGVGAFLVSAPAMVTVRVTLSGHEPHGMRVFDTEMLQLDISGGTLPVGVMLRESPTLPSLGMTTTRHYPGGNFAISSFFDVFTELSLDGGQTWYPGTDESGAIVPARVILVGPVPVTP